MDTNIENFLEQTVVEYMQRGAAFTSLDIANQAKDVGHRIRNNEVSEWLRRNAIRLAYVHSHLYNQTLITVDSKAVGQTLAYLYHHYQEDADVYLDRDQNPKSFGSSFAWPVMPTFLSPQPTSDEEYFSTRELARDFARTDPVAWKFHDNGNYSIAGERWSCVKR